MSTSRSRRSARGTTLGYMINQIFESTSGRIRYMSNMWALVGSRWDKRRLQNDNLIGSDRVNDKGEWDSDGRTLVKKLNTKCPNPPADDFYFDGKWWWVPAVECRKCPYHRGSVRGRRYPICTYRGEENMSKAAIETVETVNGLVQIATDKAKEIIG